MVVGLQYFFTPNPALRNFWEQCIFVADLPLNPALRGKAGLLGQCYFTVIFI
jgi:hypothetical protein